MKHLIIFGAPGAGKGTQAEKISQQFNLRHLSTGQILREIVDKEILAIMNNGSLVSDDVINQIIKQKIEEDKNSYFVFDGYPRTLKQSKYLDKLIKPEEIILINLIVSSKEVIARLSLRKRNDDTEENIKRRLKIYHKNTKPILDYYKSTNRLYKINGEASVNDVFNRLKDLITN